MFRKMGILILLLRRFLRWSASPLNMIGQVGLVFMASSTSCQINEKLTNANLNRTTLDAASLSYSGLESFRFCM
jgi:hypothetical protein